MDIFLPHNIKTQFLFYLLLCCTCLFACKARESFSDKQKMLIQSRDLNNKALSVRANQAEAIQLLDSAISMRPDYKIAFENKAVLLWEQRKLNEFLTLIQRMRALFPIDSCRFTLSRAILFELFGKKDSARQHYEQAVHMFKRYYQIIRVPVTESMLLQEYTDFLSISGYPDEAALRLAELKKNYGSTDTAVMHYKPKTAIEWMDANFRVMMNDGGKYENKEWR